ncbi:MAG: hypothetical protein ABL931_07400 [Usitatibacteraceae bacterium]
MKPFRVVLDTNVFSEDHFDSLESSPIKSLVKSGRVELLYGDVFLEEIAQAYMSDRARPSLIQRWLPFILTTAERLCDELQAIWHKELVQGRGADTQIYMDSGAYKKVVKEFASIPLDGSWDFVAATQGERKEARARKIAQRELSKKMREEVSLGLRANRKQAADKKSSLKRQGVQDDLVIGVGRNIIERYIDTRNPGAVASRWARNLTAYPYFTQFVINHVYKEVHFMTSHNAPIDLNAQADLDIMTHLLRADAVVTNETGFMSTAFNDLWRPKGRLIFTTRQFANLLHRLA